jgi:mRNA interferase MazF
MSVNRGDLFWISPNETNKIETDYTHPHVVIQVEVDRLTVCALTSNLKRAKEPGNVLLDEGEADLSKQSVIVVSQVSIVDKAQLGEYIGTLTEQRVQQVLAGMRFLEKMTEHHRTELTN